MQQEQEIVIKREELYELVWQKPMIHIAKELGISDVGLKKICKKLNVPTPDRGYWQRLEYGIKIKKDVLPQLKPGDPTEHKIQRIESNKSPEPKMQLPEDVELMLQNIRNTHPIIVSKTLENAHKLVKQTEKVLKHARAYSGFISDYSNTEILNLHISPDQLTRSLCIMDALIKAIEKNNFKVYIKNRKTVAIVCGEEIPFELKERTSRRLTTKPDTYTKYEFVPNGELLLKLPNDFYFEANVKSSFTDNKSCKLEEQLNNFLEILVPVAYGCKKRRKSLEEMERKRAEERKIQFEKYLVDELERRRATEIEKTLDLWQKSKNIREMIIEYEQVVNSVSNSISDVHKNEINEWINWANQYADKIDPLKIVQILLKK